MATIATTFENEGQVKELDFPAEGAFAINISDSNNLSIITRAIYIGGAGQMKVDMYNAGTAILFSGLVAGMLLPIRVVKVYSTETTATQIIGLY